MGWAWMMFAALELNRRNINRGESSEFKLREQLLSLLSHLRRHA